MYVVYEAPLQMLSDSPSNYLREPETMEFLGPVPTEWDETKVLDAKIAEYVVVARRNGKDWYIGAMSDWTAAHAGHRFVVPAGWKFHDGRVSGRGQCGSERERLQEDDHAGESRHEIEATARERRRMGGENSLARFSCGFFGIKFRAGNRA